MGSEHSFNSIWGSDVTHWVSLQPGRPGEAPPSLSANCVENSYAGRGRKESSPWSKPLWSPGFERKQKNRSKLSVPHGIATLQQYKCRQNQPAPRHPARLAVCTSTHLLAHGPREAWAQREFSKTKGKTVKPVQLLPREHIFAPGCLYTFQATQLFLRTRPMRSMSLQSESEAQAAREDNVWFHMPG